MAYNDYEEYMREVLGYTGVHNNSCDTCGKYSNYPGYYGMQNGIMDNTLDIEQMYPEIYRTINPIVCKMCDENTEQISEDLISRMTDNIYNTVISNVEASNIININIETRESEKEDRSVDNNETTKEENSINSKVENVRENTRSDINTRQIPRMNSRNITNNVMNRSMHNEDNTRRPRPPRPPRPQNQLLRDLIRILLLNRLLGNGRPPIRPPMRPPMPPLRPPRPRM